MSIGTPRAGDIATLAVGLGAGAVTETSWVLSASVLGTPGGPATATGTITAMMGVLSAASIRRARSTMRYETWWVGHLYSYLAVALGFGHQLALGSLFTGHEWLRVGWSGLYLAVALTVLLTRVVLPLLRHHRHRLTVAAVVPDSAGVVNVYFTGRHLDRLPVVGGQFSEWRFGTRKWWWQAHPYSLSAAPDVRSLRITVKNLGDQSGALATKLRPGTRVWAEGPYSTFTADRVLPGVPVVAVAAGVGIAPVLSLLQSLPPDHDVTLIYRIVDFTPGTIPLRSEVEQEASRRGWSLRYLTGDIRNCTIDAQTLTALAPRSLPRLTLPQGRLKSRPLRHRHPHQSLSTRPSPSRNSSRSRNQSPSPDLSCPPNSAISKWRSLSSRER